MVSTNDRYDEPVVFTQMKSWRKTRKPLTSIPPTTPPFTPPAVVPPHPSRTQSQNASAAHFQASPPHHAFASPTIASPTTLRSPPPPPPTASFAAQTPFTAPSPLAFAVASPTTFRSPPPPPPSASFATQMPFNVQSPFPLCSPQAPPLTPTAAAMPPRNNPTPMDYTRLYETPCQCSSQAPPRTPTAAGVPYRVVSRNNPTPINQTRTPFNNMQHYSTPRQRPLQQGRHPFSPLSTQPHPPKQPDSNAAKDDSDLITLIERSFDNKRYQECICLCGIALDAARGNEWLDENWLSWIYYTRAKANFERCEYDAAVSDWFKATTWTFL